MSRILLVDDEAVAREVIGAQLEQLGHTVFTAASVEEARVAFSENSMDMALVDIRLGEESGLDLLPVFREQAPDCQIALITAYASVDTAAEAMRLGASDYLVKPVQAHDLMRAVKRCLEHKRVLEENRRLEEENRQHRDHLEDKVQEQMTEIAESEKRFRAIFESIHDLYYRTDMEGRVTSVSPSCLPLTGYSPEEIIGTDITTYYADPDQRDALLQALQKNGSVNDFEVEMVHKDGTHRIASVTSHIVFDRENHPIAVEGIARDITERKRLESKLQESEEHFRALFEQSSFSIQIIASDGRTLNVNRAWERLWGVTLKDIAGYNILEDEQLQAKGITPLIQKAFAGEATNLPAILYDPVETESAPNAAHKHWIRAFIFPLKDEQGNVREGVLIHEDITSRKQAEIALNKSEKSFRNLVESAFDAIIVHEDMKVLYANPAAQKMFGASNLQSAIGRSVLNYVHPRFRSFAEKRVNQVIRKRQPIPSIELKAVLQTGDELDIDITSAPITYEDKAAVLSIVRNVTERKHREKAITRLSEENRRLAQQLILAQDAERRSIGRELHDELGQNLMMIKTEIARATSRSRNRSELAEIIATINSATDEVIANTRNIFDRLRPAIMDGIGLTEEIETQVKRWENCYGVACSLAISGKLDDLNEQISLTAYRIVQECLTNVAKHASASKVHIQLRRRPQNVVDSKECDAVLLVVADDGKGMDLDKLDSKGLGLFGMRERVHAAGGSFDMRSMPGEGTRISVDLPITHAKEDSHEQA